MNEPLGTFSDEHSVILPCPVSEGEIRCSIPLPRQSHLGTYEGLDYRPPVDWQASFLCLRHGRAYVCSTRDIHLEIQARDPDQPVSSLWQVEAFCGRCKAVHSAYTGKMPDWTS